MAASATTVTRRRSGIVAVVVALVAVLVASPTPTDAVEELPGRFLAPLDPGIVTGTTEFVVAYPDAPDGAVMEFWINWNDPEAGPQWFRFGEDDDDEEIGLAGYPPVAGTVAGEWHAPLELPPHHPPGLADIWAQLRLCEVPEDPFTCTWTDIAMLRVWADGEAALPEFLTPISVAPPGEIDIEITVPEEVDGVDLFLRSLFPPNKGLPKLDQHVVGVDRSGDLDGDGTKGDMSCAPTAAASSLLWFDAHGHPNVVADDKSAKDLVNDLGVRAGTSDQGTSPAKLAKAIEAYMAANGMADQFEVSDFTRAAKPVETIAKEFGRGQDVLLGVYWDVGGGHALAVDSVTVHPDGSADIGVMDPWTGTIETIKTDAAGKGTLGTKKLTIGVVMHVSPTKKAEKKIGTATPTGNGGSGFGPRAAVANDTYELTWDASDVLPGSYLLRAGATDPDASAPDGAPRELTLSDHGIVHIEGTARLAGEDRLLTGLEVSQASYGDGEAGAVVLARSEEFPDALAGTPLAIGLFAPLLLTPPEGLDPRVEDEIQRVLPAGGTVYLLGGPVALNPGIQTRLEELGYVVVRYGGENRYDTAVTIAEEGLGDPDLLMVASGTNFPDALAGGAAAGIVGGAVVLTADDQMPPDSAAYIADRTDADRYAIGGPAAAADPAATPLVGEDRFETAVMVAERFVPDPPAIGLATGFRFPDALTGGVHVGRRGGPILLARPDELPEVVRTYLEDNRAPIMAGYLYGGLAALEESVRTAVDAIIHS